MYQPSVMFTFVKVRKINKNKNKIGCKWIITNKSYNTLKNYFYNYINIDSFYRLMI